MRTIIAAVSILSLAILSAHASAGLSCDASDKAVTLAIEAGISRGLGDDVFSFKGALDILSSGAPKDFRKIEFGKDNLTQRWLDNRNLTLRIYRERASEPHGYVDLVIEAWPRKDSDGIEFRGGYVLTIFDIPTAGADGKTTVLKGRVTCSTG